MNTPSLLAAKNRTLPRLLIDPSMDYHSSSSSVSSLSRSNSTGESSSMHSLSGGGMLVRSIYDFDGSGSEQLSFHCGEVLEVIYRDSSVSAVSTPPRYTITVLS